MLHRAANNAYSWWWASHIRTKQSKWLEQNLQDVEEKVQSMLKIIEQDGDSFAKRAEMYYKKRPELINFVEESYRAYRALAERYDLLSRDLQSANRTIATVFPEQIHLSLESDDDEQVTTSTTSHVSSEKSLKTSSSPPAAGNIMIQPPKGIPKAPKFPANLKAQPMLASKREQLIRRPGAAPPFTSASGLSKEEALKEIDTLQKDILVLQTEREYVKSSYENGLAKYWDIEAKITELQGKVCGLEDEFGVGTVIEDHEARSLMAATALKSCGEALTKLQEEQERYAEQGKAEQQRIEEARDRLGALNQLAGQELQIGSTTDELDQQDIEALKQRIKEQFKLDSSTALTEPELAEKINNLVERIVTLETALCSQNALLKRLKKLIDQLLANIRALEEEKVSLAEGSALLNKLKHLEEELLGAKSLNKELVDQNNKLEAELIEARCNVDHLKEKLQDVRPAEEGYYERLGCKLVEKHDEAVVKESGHEQEEEARDDQKINASHHHLGKVDEANNNSLLIDPDHHNDKEDEEDVDKHTSQTGDSSSSTLDNELPADMRLEEEGGLNWRQLYLNNIEERERILVEEYTVILRDYKDMKMKLGEVEKKNRDSISDLTSHVRELRSLVAIKDDEIQMLRKKLAALSSSSSNIKAEPGVVDNCCSSLDVDPNHRSKEDRKPLYHYLYDLHDKELIAAGGGGDDQRVSPKRQGETTHRPTRSSDVSAGSTAPRPLSRAESRLRAQLDDLLESNLDFWLRFSTSFHQIQKFQTSIKDLQGELSKLREAKKQEERSGLQGKNNQLKSDARPLYKHLREIQTELTLWLEHSTVFQEELKSRFSSLNNIQAEISKASHSHSHSGKKAAAEVELSDYQAAKFQGEVLNMKQENNKVAEELQAGMYRVRVLKVEMDKELSRLDKEFGLLETKHRQPSFMNSSSKPRIPLQSFLFGVKLKKQRKPSIFACMNPMYQKQHSTIVGLQQ